VGAANPPPGDAATAKSILAELLAINTTYEKGTVGRKRAVNPKKLHGVDWALGYPLVPEPFINAGHKIMDCISPALDPIDLTRQRTRRPAMSAPCSALSPKIGIRDPVPEAGIRAHTLAV
jgi:hypothetical protein